MSEQKTETTEAAGREASDSLSALLCCEDCGKPFARTKKYMQSKRRDVMFKWRTHKCDACVEIKVKTALKILPEVIDSLAT